MAKHRIEQRGRDLSIALDEVEGRTERLLEAFQECQEGRCSCPTDEYDKLETLEITSDESSINLLLKAKEGQSFDRDEIEKCLEYTERKAAADEDRDAGE